MRVENAFHPVQSATPDANPLARLKKGTGEKRTLLCHYGAHLFNFLFRNGSLTPRGAYKIENPRRFQHGEPSRRSRHDVHKQVTGKQRKLHFLATVTPAVHLADEGQKSIHSSLSQAQFNALFMARSGVDRIPAEVIRRPFARIYALAQFAHGFAV